MLLHRLRQSSVGAVVNHHYRVDPLCGDDEMDDEMDDEKDDKDDENGEDDDDDPCTLR